jgi:hypothetical protein
MRGSIRRIWRTAAGKTPFPRSGSRPARGTSSLTTTTCRPRTGAWPISSTRREPPSLGVARRSSGENDAAVSALAAHDRLRHGGGNEALIDEVAAPRFLVKISQLCNCEQYCTYGWRRIAFNQPALRMASAAGRPDPGFPIPPHPPPGGGPGSPCGRGGRWRSPRYGANSTNPDQLCELLRLPLLPKRCRLHSMGARSG